jgi:peptidoglycan/xylan/chitin deacetylase (PgdA/CDA1 family)
MQSGRGPATFLFAVVIGVGAALGGAALDTAPAHAQTCPGHPDALGTSRDLVVEPDAFAHVGLMQYRQTLPLADKEVVLTFDDGPLPRYTDQILDILAAQCVKATYFLVGEMARQYPATVRRIFEEGHTIGTHSEDHPGHFQKLPVDEIRWEIDEGIADVGGALGDPKELAPFFRIPGLARTDAIEQELSARSLIAFSSDVVADDWHRRIRPKEIVRRAMARLEARGRGILLLHDIHPATVAALPELLGRLKREGFHIVHVIPAATSPVETAAPSWGDQWSDPALTALVAAEATRNTVLPAPEAAAFDPGYLPRQKIMLAARSASAVYLALAAGTEWSDPARAPRPPRKADLPAPDVRDAGVALLQWPGGAVALGVSPDISLPAVHATSDEPAADAAPAAPQE